MVLPFTDLGGDPDLAWFVEGFVEDITTELSRFRDLFVVARNSAFVHRQVPLDLRAIALELDRCSNTGQRGRNRPTTMQVVCAPS